MSNRAAVIWLLTLVPTSVTGLLVLPTAWAALTIALVLVATLFWIELSRLPALAMIAWALLPVAFLPIPLVIGRYANPAIIALSIWCLRAAGAKLTSEKTRLDRWVRFAIVLLALWLCYGTIASIDSARSFRWSANLLVTLTAGYLAYRADRVTIRRLVGTWAFVAVTLGAFATIEWLTKSNPLSQFYFINDVPIGQRWSVYRVQTTLGHPLTNSVFFGTSAAYFAWRATWERRPVILAAAMFSVAGLLGTVSRGATLGLAVGLAAAVVLFISRSPAPFSRKAGVLVGAALFMIAVSQSPLLAERSASSEGTQSNAYRSAVLEAALAIARADGYWGAGPGTAQQRFEMVQTGIIVENSAIQLLMSVGIIGCIILTVVLALLFWQGFVAGRWELVAGALAYLISAVSFNAWDSNPGTFVPLALLLVLARVREERAQEESKTLKALVAARRRRRALAAL